MTKTNVLIVGAGPVGLSLSVELARRGINFRIIDKAAEPSTISKALACHARTLELFEDMGVLEAFQKRGVLTHGFSIYSKGHRLVHLSFDEMVCPYPFIIMLPQSETEGILAERLEQLNGRVERGQELVQVTENNKSVTAVVKAADGSEEIISADWLVACDGSHSTIRKQLNLPFHGSAYDEIFACCDGLVNTHLAHDEVNTFLSEDGAFVMFPLPNNRWRVLYDLPASETRDKNSAPTLEEAQQMMNERGPGVPISDPSWLAYFKINRRHIDAYRHGRVLLAGDAAHIHSPMGGVGMNTGIQDAVNLGWKLELVLKGLAGEKLLDSYHDERHPIAKDVLAGTDFATKVATLRNPVSQAVRNKLMSVLSDQEVIQQRLLKNGSTIAVNYRKSKIVGEYRAGLFAKGAESPSLGERTEFANGPRPGDRAPDAIAKRAAADEDARFFDITRGTGHKLILFDGADASAAGYENLGIIASQVKAKYPELINVFTVTPQTQLPPELAGVSTLIYDKEMELHRLYGANSECLYLIRPDGYIGFRSQPAMLDKLIEHMELLTGTAALV